MSSYTKNDVRDVANALRRSHILDISAPASVLLARAVLEIVAPRLEAKSLRDLADEMDAPDWNHKDDWNVSAIYPNALRTRADWIEGKR